MKKVRRAVIPAAGLGTRFLPATKTVPKELLPIVDRPTLLYVVEEAALAGIEDIILISGRNKTAIEDFFDVSYELEDKLTRDGKAEWVDSLERIRRLANIISIRQQRPLGLGHAISCARSVVGSEPFAVLLGDEIMVQESISQPTVTAQLARLFQDSGLSSVAVMEVPESDVSKYGIVEGTPHSPGVVRATRLIEKPAPGQTKSRLALPGRYVFDSRVFSYISESKPGKNGEIQLTDAMAQLAANEGLLATRFQARRYDAGDKLGYLVANIEEALRRPELGRELREYLVGRLKTEESQ
jgi:UTP--glucose-1-phosphate uridylyltransferase